jgi:hypothetical protein
VQFENITGKFVMAGAMADLKIFLEMDSAWGPQELPLTNWKHKRGDEDAVSRMPPPALHGLRCIISGCGSPSHACMLPSPLVCVYVCRWGGIGT